MKLHRKTKHLVIRPHRPGDYRTWRKTISSLLPKQNEWDEREDREDLSRKRFNKILQNQKAHRKKDDFYDLGVFLKDGTLLGSVSIMDLSRGVFQNAYLGYRIYNPFWGKGYGKEAVRAGIDIAFRDLKLHRVEAGIDPKNRRSIRLARGLRFRKEGLSKRRLFLDNKWRDMILFVLTTEDVGLRFSGKARLMGGRV